MKNRCAFFVSVILVAALFTAGCVQIDASHPVSFAGEQGKILSHILACVGEDLAALDANVSGAASGLEIAGIEGAAAQQLLEDLVNSSAYIVDAITIGSDGRILAVAPAEYQDSIGKNISAQSHIQLLFASRSPVFSGAFTTVEGFDAVSLAYPILSPGGEMLGAVSALIRPEVMLGDAIRPALGEYPYTAFAIQPDGRVLYDLDPDEIGKMTLEDPIYQSYPDLLALAQRVIAERSGFGKYSFLATGTQEKVTIWNTVSLHGSEWRIIVTREP
jgi:hypothetical protein